jgi:hypothetical protein
LSVCAAIRQLSASAHDPSSADCASSCCTEQFQQLGLQALVAQRILVEMLKIDG